MAEFDSTIMDRALAVATWGEILVDRKRIRQLRETPWFEVEVFSSTAHTSSPDEPSIEIGFVNAGPVNRGGYYVSKSAQDLKWELYVLRLDGDTDTYLGYGAQGRRIFKIGVSVSPDSRRMAFQKSMPEGAFKWRLHRTNRLAKLECYSNPSEAVAGEYAIEKHLAACAKHLGGEFYLATEKQIQKAWQLGHAAAKAFGKKK